MIVGVVILHIWRCTSRLEQPDRRRRRATKDTLPFHPFYTAKDLFGLGVFLIVFALFVFFAPNSLGHPDNYIPANPLPTPAHIVPEWYFLPFYAILRAFTVDVLFIPAKLWGVLAMFGSILLLFFLPWLDTSPVRSSPLPADVQVVLLAAGGRLRAARLSRRAAARGHSTCALAQLATAYYFVHFLIILPLLGKFERPLPLPRSISEPVLEPARAASPAE